MPLSTLRVTPRDVPRKTRGQDGFATSFPAGDLHPLQHAGLSRRSPVSRSHGSNRSLLTRRHFVTYPIMIRQNRQRRRPAPCSEMDLPEYDATARGAAAFQTETASVAILFLAWAGIIRPTWGRRTVSRRTLCPDSSVYGCEAHGVRPSLSAKGLTELQRVVDSEDVKTLPSCGQAVTPPKALQLTRLRWTSSGQGGLLHKGLEQFGLDDATGRPEMGASMRPDDERSRIALRPLLQWTQS
jgi:hypothetical protein